MGDDTKRPGLKVVAENSDRDIQRNLAWEKAEAALVELTANILRVVRGAGRPNSIGEECDRVAIAFEEYQSVAGRCPSSFDIGNAIQFRDRPYDIGFSEESQRVDWARNLIVRGGLQVAASQILGQLTQQRAGESEMTMGLRELADAQEAYRQKLYGKSKARCAAKKPRKGKGSAKTIHKRSGKEDIQL
ncbi:hypothetical protein M2322_003171 [Rhodoblastus acidophilus]|uniref:hypothetical protein n=1 Tax=Rhodoblastus acidophilus TaxID=1074 RepID=UPI002224623F|nr:hypothetical protein [Rhodoblastus acidophilus]MCW2317607.1 hypothetical protein [Rhodoblastus acidophilus]